MGFTERQTKFIFRIKDLLSLRSSASLKERKILTQASYAFNNGEDFKKVINVLSLDLRDIEKYYQNGLSKDVDKLFKDIKEVYGEPQDYKGARRWQDDDPELEWVGNGRYGGRWRRKGWDDPAIKKSFLSQLISNLTSIVILALVVLLSFLLLKLF